MPIKNHYQVLEVPVQASSVQIKKAYRQLVKQYHPDANQADPAATGIFQEIQLAYEVLSHPIRRRAYDKDLRSTGQYTVFEQDEVYNAAGILKQCDDLSRYLLSQSEKNINSDALADFILALLNQSNVALLKRNKDKAINEQIVACLLSASQSIVSSRLFAQIADALLEVLPDEAQHLESQIMEALLQRKQVEQQNKRVPFAAIGIILLMILAMILILFRNKKP